MNNIRYRLLSIMLKQTIWRGLMGEVNDAATAPWRMGGATIFIYSNDKLVLFVCVTKFWGNFRHRKALTPLVLVCLGDFHCPLLRPRRPTTLDSSSWNASSGSASPQIADYICTNSNADWYANSEVGHQARPRSCSLTWSRWTMRATSSYVIFLCCYWDSRYYSTASIWPGGSGTMFWPDGGEIAIRESLAIHGEPCILTCRSLSFNWMARCRRSSGERYLWLENRRSRFCVCCGVNRTWPPFRLDPHGGSR